MRILFVTPYPVSRIRVRSYGFVTHLARQHDVRVLALCAGRREVEDVQELQRQDIAITAIREQRAAQYLRGLRALSSRLPLQVAFAASPTWRHAIQSHVASGQFDLLHVESIRALGVLPQTLPIPVVWDAVDCISRLYELGAQAAATLRMRTLGALEARRTRHYEREHLNHFQHVLVTSERDRQALLNIPASRPDTAQRPVRITALSHGVDQAYFQPYTGPRHPETLVFSGKMSFHANIAAVSYLLQQILPRIWQQRPAVRLVIAGSDPPLALRLLARDPRIELTGHVSDLRPHIAQAQVALTPMPYAVGIQNKVLEAMALGTPVVATPCVATGLHAVAGRDFLVADTPETFAQAVLRLLDDQALWHRLAQSGLNYIATFHNWDSISQKLSAIYQHVLTHTTTEEVYQVRRDG